MALLCPVCGSDSRHVGDDESSTRGSRERCPSTEVCGDGKKPDRRVVSGSGDECTRRSTRESATYGRVRSQMAELIATVRRRFSAVVPLVVVPEPSADLQAALVCHWLRLLRLECVCRARLRREKTGSERRSGAAEPNCRQRFRGQKGGGNRARFVRVAGWHQSVRLSCASRPS